MGMAAHIVVRPLQIDRVVLLVRSGRQLNGDVHHTRLAHKRIGIPRTARRVVEVVHRLDAVLVHLRRGRRVVDEHNVVRRRDLPRLNRLLQLPLLLLLELTVDEIVHHIVGRALRPANHHRVVRHRDVVQYARRGRDLVRHRHRDRVRVRRHVVAVVLRRDIVVGVLRDRVPVQRVTELRALHQAVRALHELVVHLVGEEHAVAQHVLLRVAVPREMSHASSVHQRLQARRGHRGNHVLDVVERRAREAHVLELVERYQLVVAPAASPGVLVHVLLRLRAKHVRHVRPRTVGRIREGQHIALEVVLHHVLLPIHRARHVVLRHAARDDRQGRRDEVQHLELPALLERHVVAERVERADAVLVLYLQVQRVDERNVALHYARHVLPEHLVRLLVRVVAVQRNAVQRLPVAVLAALALDEISRQLVLLPIDHRAVRVYLLDLDLRHHLVLLAHIRHVVQDHRARSHVVQVLWYRRAQRVVVPLPLLHRTVHVTHSERRHYVGAALSRHHRHKVALVLLLVLAEHVVHETALAVRVAREHALAVQSLSRRASVHIRAVETRLELLQRQRADRLAAVQHRIYARAGARSLDLLVRQRALQYPPAGVGQHPQARVLRSPAEHDAVAVAPVQQHHVVVLADLEGVLGTKALHPHN